MKIKAAQIVGGISMVACLLANFMFVVNIFTENDGFPRITFDFLTWPISFFFEFLGLLLFVLLYKKNFLSYVGLGTFLFSHFAYTFYWNSKFDSTFLWTLKQIINWPVFGLGSFYTIGSLFGFLSFVTVVVAVVLSFFDSSPATSISHQGISMVQSPVPNFATQTQSRGNQGNLSEIEVLGDLLQKGLLTQEEFDRKKREILGFN